MSSKKSIIVICAALIALFGVIWLARPNGDSGASSGNNNALIGQLKTEEAYFDFGTISMAAGKVRHTFKLKNTGDGDVTLKKIYTSCMCTTATLVRGGEKLGPFGMPGHGIVPGIKELVRASEEVGIEVEFDPAAHGPAGVGTIERDVYIENSSGAPVTFRFTAAVTP